MKPTLGDRIRAEREKVKDAADAAKSDACAEAHAYTDAEIVDVKAWVEDRIAQLASDNSLINNP
jgi:hypothetical protein